MPQEKGNESIVFLFNFLAISVGIQKKLGKQVLAGAFCLKRRFSADLLAEYGSPVTT